MEMKQLPSPDALKRIMMMLGVKYLVGWGTAEQEETAQECGFDDVCEWLEGDILTDYFTLSYDPETGEYRYDEIPGGDNEFLHFVAAPNYCFVCSCCCEGGRPLPREEIPAEIYDRIDEVAGTCATLFAWSVDGKTWNQPEGFDCSTFNETILDRFFDRFPDFDEERFRQACPLWYQVYKQVPFDNDMLLEWALLRELSQAAPATATGLELPEVAPVGQAKVLKYFVNYPTALREDYEPALTAEHVEELTAKGLYALAAYCAGRMAAERPDDAALRQRADDLYGKAKELVENQKDMDDLEGGEEEYDG
ncbi:hypothetical protein [uncultured Rikenella sp.]|uniref:hypothetical protein n=2 Tax=uncultured Rikenella sp. TaxID=368003 RepID=UPI002617B991|nr:hypothetical protein [uncultured Rikenella sp.]